MIHLVIKGNTPTLNKYINAERTNRYIAAKIKRETTEMVAWQCLTIPAVTKPAHYIFTWFVANKRSDPDNIAYGCKYIFDGLQASGKLPNDSMKWVLSITHRFEIGESRVEVQINEA